MADRKKEAKALQPLLNVGKNGVTQNFLDELDLAFKKRELVKIKLLSSCEEDVKTVETKVNTALRTSTVDSVGRTLTFTRKKHL